MAPQKKLENTRNNVALIINSLIGMIENPNISVEANAYYYHKKELHLFIICLYSYKLTINSDEYIKQKYHQYISKYKKQNIFKYQTITDIECQDALSLLLIVKNKIIKNDIIYDEKNEKIYFYDNTYIDVKWFLTFLSLILDNTKNEELKEIKICYCIPNKDISKCTKEKEREKFLSQIRFYSIDIKRTEQSKELKENHILIVKNAAINYLKHLKKYKHGLENKESYQIFYNLLKNECIKENLQLIEEDNNLLDIDQKLLDRINTYIDDSFYTYDLNKQVKLVEDIIWQSGNDITLLEHTNTSVDSLIDFLTIIHLNKTDTYQKIKDDNNIKDLQIILILSTFQFLLTYQNNHEEIDYSLLDLSKIKPKYMNSICHNKEEILRDKIKSLKMELSQSKKTLDTYKVERNQLDSASLSKGKYQKSLELCVSKINSIRINIARLNSTLSALSKEHDSLQNIQRSKYKDIEKYNYNHSIIKHICNSIIGCNFYLKTSNNRDIFSNIIIFEDYEKTENSFYLEVSFKELLKISNHYVLNSILEQKDLPKLA